MTFAKAGQYQIMVRGMWKRLGPPADPNLVQEMRSRLQRLGILRESGHEHFNGSVVFPIFDLEGNVLGMYGRKITPNLQGRDAAASVSSRPASGRVE